MPENVTGSQKMAEEASQEDRRERTKIYVKSNGCQQSTTVFKQLKL
jgi:hypothetical protein